MSIPTYMRLLLFLQILLRRQLLRNLIAWLLVLLLLSPPEQICPLADRGFARRPIQYLLEDQFSICSKTNSEFAQPGFDILQLRVWTKPPPKIFCPKGDFTGYGCFLRRVVCAVEVVWGRCLREIQNQNIGASELGPLSMDIRFPRIEAF